MRFYTSDLHLGHKRIIELCDRPFRDVEEMNYTLIERINEVAAPEDELWILGDLALGTLVESLELIQYIQPEVHLVNGNHDRTWIGSKPKERAKAHLYLEAGVQSLQDFAIHNIYNMPVALSHFPYKGAEQGDHMVEDRYVDYRPTDEGNWLLCGHVHNLWRLNGRMINVGVDVQNFYPVSEEAIVDFIRRNDA